MTLVTHQTGPEGKTVRKLLVEEALDIRRELYVGIVIDRAREAAVVMASTEGGVEIEKVAAEKPELIFKEYVDPAVGLAVFQAKRLAFKLGLAGETHKRRPGSCSRCSGPSKPRTPRWRRSTLSSLPETAGSWPSTPR